MIAGRYYLAVRFLGRRDNLATAPDRQAGGSYE
jgi:hypothetical protein